MRTLWAYGLAACALVFSGCNGSPTPPEAPLYAISWYYPNDDYQHWVRGQDSSARFIELYSQDIDKIDSILGTCAGLILSGGSDIAPERYGGSDTLALSGRIDPRRDSVELTAVAYVQRRGLPTLGVCRGMQVMNVAFGGDLILDIPTFNGSKQHQTEGSDAMHLVYPAPALARLLEADSATVNCNHHQAVAHLGEGLEAVARSSDTIIEAMRHSDTVRFPFLWGVQWHPERLDGNSPMSSNLLTRFIEATKKP